MCLWKLCYVPDFGNFCSGKHNFGVGMHTCLLLWLYHICFWKSVECPRNTDSLSKVPDSVVHEKKKKAFLIIPESSQNLMEPLLDACVKDMCRFVLRSALCVRRRHETIEVSPKFVEKNITNQGTSCEKCFVSEGKHGRVCWSCACKTVSCGKETFPNIQESIMRVVAVHHH